MPSRELKAACEAQPPEKAPSGSSSSEELQRNGECRSPPAERQTSAPLRTWTILCVIKAVLIFIVVSIAISIWGRSFAADFSGHSTPIVVSLHSESPSPFEDLDGKEIELVKSFITQQLRLVDIDKAKVNDDYLYNVHLLEPSKQLPSVRQAVVVVFHGSRTHPIVQEYIVGPVVKNKPATVMSRNLGRSVHFHKRPFSLPEHKVLKSMILQLLKEMAPAFLTVYAYVLKFDVPDSVVSEYTSIHVDEGKRITWFRINHLAESDKLHPVDLQFCIFHDGVNVSTWKIQKIRFYNKEYNSVKLLLEDTTSADWPGVGRLSRFNLRHKFRERHKGPRWTPDNTVAPQVDSSNYLVMNPWRMKVAFRSITGLRMFNITYNERPVLYELGLSEAVNIFEGASPYMQRMFSVLSMYGIGANVKLKPNIDCPPQALYFSGWIVSDGRPRFVPHTACAFQGLVTTYRHLEFGLGKDSHNFEGKRDWVLTVRSVTSIRRSNYFFDYNFYQTGVIELIVWVSGLVVMDVVAGEVAGNKYGQVLMSTDGTPSLHRTPAPSRHFHLFHYKADFEFDRTLRNSIHVLSILGSNYTIKKRQVDKEKAFPEPSSSNYFLHCSSTKPSCCYRVLNRAEISPHFSKKDGFYKAASWARTGLAMSLRKDNESDSSIFYNGVDPANPTVQFSDFTEPPEDLREKDVVSWITMGTFHDAHDESLPFILTGGNVLRSYLIPHNFLSCKP